MEEFQGVQSYLSTWWRISNFHWWYPPSNPFRIGLLKTNLIGINTSKIDYFICKRTGISYIKHKFYWNRAGVKEQTSWRRYKTRSEVAPTTEKVSKRLFYLRQLKSSGLSESNLVRICKSFIRPICEYLRLVWFPVLILSLLDQIKSILKRALKIVRPWDSYQSATETQTRFDPDFSNSWREGSNGRRRPPAWWKTETTNTFLVHRTIRVRI